MAVNYFIKNYYHQRKSRWSGKASEKLGLSGEIEDEQAFKNVIEGRSPDGSEKLNARVLNQKERRAALDCTFSAPKSVSLMALVGGDTRLIDAHHQALQKVIQLMEERYATTRVMEGDTRHRISTNNLLVAQFDHIESRDLDPHLHTHCLVMNTTQTPDGKWYSLVNGEIYANKKFLGIAYQSYLANEVMKLGYEIEPKLHGQFEIKGFKEQDLEAFSKRRQQIIAKCGASSSWAEREKVWDKTRQRKHLVSPDELQALWHEEAQNLGISFVKPSEPKTEVVIENAQNNLKQVLEDAVAHCSERNVAFKFEDVAKFILNERLATDVTQIEPLLKQHPQIIALEGLEQYTTLKAVEREIATIELMEQGKQKVNPISHPEMIESQLEKTLLNQGQRQAVEMALTTTDQFVAWQGVAGAGKTFALKELKAIAEDAEYTIKAFAPSSMAAKVLSEELDIQGETVARLLVSEPPQEPEPNQIWIVDEAGLLSAKDAYTLLEKATAQGARLLLVGDTKQLSAVEAGNPFKSLQQAGIQTAHLTQSNRQRNPDLKIAVDLIAEGRTEAGFQQLDSIGSIAEVSPESKLEIIASEYIALTPSQRERTLVLAGTNAEKLALTQVIRDKLKVEGSLGKSASITQLQAKNLSKVQMQYTHNYELGDVVMPTRNYKRRGLEKGKLYKVIDKGTDQLTVEASDGTTLKVNTGFEGAVYQCNEIEIAVGERLQWKKNDLQLQRRNGQEFVVTAVDEETQTAQIQYKDSERSETIDLKQAQNLDYALVTTTYSSQGKTAERALISADYTIGQESFYVAVSRAKDSVKLFTEDKQYLLELAQKSKVKDNALELLRKQVKQQMVSSKNDISIIIEEPVAVSTVAPPVLKSKVVEQPVTVSTITAVTETPKQQQPLSSSVAISKPIPQQATPEGATVEKPKLKKRIPTEAFWTPTHDAPSPSHIDSKHWQELVEKSAIHPQIAALNFESLHFGYVGGEHEAWNRLMISDKLNRTNTGGLTKGFLELYSHVDAGGWWCNSGVDPRCFASLTPGTKPTTKEWGCYKPNQPRPKKDENGQVIPDKFIKYEHPPKVELSLFLLDVPEEIVERIYALHRINPNQSDRHSGFWYCVWKYNLPVTITEGAKKAASLLSQGHVTIGLPGISAGYRSPKDEYGQKIGKSYLAQELAVFATPNREFKFCFDYETKPKTKLNIERDISTTGWLLQKQGSRVKVITLPGPDKGVDDFIVAQGPLAYEKVCYETVSLRDWQQSKKQQADAVEAPRKLTLNPLKEKTHDINQQQLQQPAAIRNDIINREDRSTVEQPRKTERPNRTVTNSQPAVKPENSTLGTSTVGEVERVENESHRVFAAISRHIELEEIKQLEGHLRELNRSITSGEFRGQRTAQLATDAHPLHTANIDSTASDVRPEPNRNEQLVTGQLINIISEFLETKVIESGIKTKQLQTLIHNLLPHQRTTASEQVQKTLGAIANFSEQQAVELTLAEALPSVTQAIKHTEQPLKKQTSHHQVMVTIAEHVELSEIESSTVTQTIREVVEQLKQLQKVMTESQTAIASKQVQVTLEAIANFVEQEAVESALVEALSSVTKSLSLYQQELVRGTKTDQNVEQILIEQPIKHQALGAIAKFVELQEIEAPIVVQTLQKVVEQLKLFVPPIQKPIEERKLEVKNTVFATTNKALEKKCRKQIELLSDKDFVNLVKYVKSYFQENSETEHDPQTHGLLIVREILRQMKAEVLEQTKVETQKEQQFKL